MFPCRCGGIIASWVIKAPTGRFVIRADDIRVLTQQLVQGDVAMRSLDMAFFVLMISACSLFVRALVLGQLIDGLHSNRDPILALADPAPKQVQVGPFWHHFLHEFVHLDRLLADLLVFHDAVYGVGHRLLVVPFA